MTICPTAEPKYGRKRYRAVRRENPDTSIELLIPDFDAREDLIDTVIAAKPDIIGHNVETVARLTPQVRSRAVTRSASKLCRISRGRAAEPKAA